MVNEKVFGIFFFQPRHGKKIFPNTFSFYQIFLLPNFFSNWFFFRAFWHDRQVHTKCRQVCKKAICCHNCPNKFVWKKSPRVNKIFFQVTLVEKGHLGNISRPWPSASASKTFPWCPFSTLVTWKKFLFTLGQFFLTICPDNFDNKILL